MPFTSDDIAARLGMSTNMFFWEGPDLGQPQVQRLADAGITRIELAADMAQLDHNNPEQIAALRRVCRDCGVQIVSYHCPDLPWGCPYPEIRKGTIAEFLKMCEAASALGGPIMVCHFERNEHHESFIREFLPLLEGTDVRLTIENGEDLADFAAFVDKIGSDRFGMIVDIGHTKDADGANPFTCADRARQTIQICGKRLFHLHLHEFWDGADHWQPFYKGGLIEWGELFAGLADIDYDGAFMFESVPAIPNDPAAFDAAVASIATFPDEFARRYGPANT